MILTAASILLAACQSDTYKIYGLADSLNNGDTLFITTDFANGNPLDTIIVENGKFEIEGTADSTFLCLIYNHNKNMFIPFFIEPGNINIQLSDNPVHNRVSGTSTNNKWREMNDSSIRIGREISIIASQLNTSDLTNDEQDHLIEKYGKLMSQFRALVLKYTKANISNEFGYFLLTYYDDFSNYNSNENFIDAKTKLELIKEMPERMRNRPSIQSLIAQLKNMYSFAEGNKIVDITMNDIYDNETSLMKEIVKSKITIIDFWASWCVPCREEMPNLINLYSLYKDSGLGIIGISLDSKKEDWVNATKMLSIGWVQISDLQGWDNVAAHIFNITSIPQTIIVKQDGTILKRGLGGIELQQFVKSYLSDK